MDYMDEFVISSIINIHMELSQDIEFLGLAKMASRGTTNQKVASSSLAGRTTESTTYADSAYLNYSKQAVIGDSFIACGQWDNDRIGQGSCFVKRRIAKGIEEYIQLWSTKTE